MKTRTFLISGACFLLAAMSFPQNAFATPFSNPSTYGTGSAPYDVVLGDWNKDGALDAATANNSDDTLSGFLNDGFGGMTNHFSDTTCSQPFNLTTSDFNGDTWPDLVTSCDGADQVSVFLNKADGTGSFNHGVTSTAGSEPRGLVAYDFDGDGNMDLADASFSGGIDILIGNGDGTFQAPVTYAAGLYTLDVIAGDFDGNGRMDLVANNSCAGCFVPYNTGSVSFFSGNGDGTFAAAVNSSSGRGSTSLVGGDWDGDGNRDLALVKPRHDSMGVMTGNGDGTFNLLPDYTSAAYPQGITSGDVNQDGITDILTSNSSAANFSVYIGRDNGTFVSYVTTTAGTNPIGMALGDLNRDGKLDLALTNQADNTLALYFDTSPPTITTLSPNSTTVGGAGITVTITGSGFAPNSKGRVNGSDRPTSYVSPTSLNVNIGQSDVERNGTLNFTVYNPTLTLTSNSSTFSVTGSINGGGGLPPEAFLPPAEPQGGFAITLDNGAAQTSNRKVRVTFRTDAGARVPVAKSFAISNTEDFSGASILPLPASGMDWDLCAKAGGAIVPTDCASGPHTVYAKFYSGWGQASPVAKAEIQYGQAPSSLTGSQPLAAAPTLTSAPRFYFNRTLKLGATGNDVRELQRFLNAQGFVLAQTGPGSMGNETVFFGPATADALKRFQAAHAEHILKPLGLTLPTGHFGTATKDFVNNQ